VHYAVLRSVLRSAVQKTCSLNIFKDVQWTSLSHTADVIPIDIAPEHCLGAVSRYLTLLDSAWHMNTAILLVRERGNRKQARSHQWKFA